MAKYTESILPINNVFVRLAAEENPRIIVAAEAALHYCTIRDMQDELKHEPNYRVIDEFGIDICELGNIRRKAAEDYNFQFSMLENYEVGYANQLVNEWENELYNPSNNSCVAVGRDGWYF